MFFLAVHTPGFIPAHAGNTLRVFSGGAYSRVHPRSRGEYRPPGTSKRPITGSPPLTRGIPLVHVDTVRRHRFTPAHAGNTESLRSQWLLLQVHPRSRGEYSACLTSCHAFIGSPPLTRGIHFSGSPGSKRHRFTPAHAGNTHVNAEEAGSLEVHPRSRGEYLLTLHQTDPEPGSSPLTRGIRGPKPENVEKARFIPAHAGNTTGSSNGTRRTQVHPRSRGEYSSQHFGSCKWIGSSPLTRGILPVLIIFAHVFRFIPAHAGNTQTHRQELDLSWVHPRSRGEY